MNHSRDMYQRGLAWKGHAHFWTLHYALINWQWLMAPSIGHAPWKNDTFPRNCQQIQACIIDELGENHLGLVTNLRFKSVLLEGLPTFLIMASLWNRVNSPWGKGFIYVISLQLRRPVLSAWFCFRHYGWSWKKHVENVSYACWTGVPFSKVPIWV